MQLPIDIKALLNEMTDIKAARECALSVSVFLDSQAPADIAAHVRGLFGSSSATLRMTVSYLDDTFMPHADDDIAIVVAGKSRGVGAAAAAIRAAGVPVAVVTTLPTFVTETASKAGYAIPIGDLVAPYVQDASDEPVELTEELAKQLDERLGRWIVAVCPDKRLPMAMAFSFLRRPLAKDAVQVTSLQNAGIGLVPLIPGADLPIMTLNQAKMMLQIAAAYGHEMDKTRAKELAAVVGGAYLCRVVARELVEFVPVLGFIIKPGVAYGGTSAVGYAAIEYFEGGEDVAGVLNVAQRATEKGSQIVSKLRDGGPDLVPEMANKVRGLADRLPVVKQKAHEYAPKVVAVVDDLVDGAMAFARA
jgi:uncharacterized protein (DUF697 family)